MNLKDTRHAWRLTFAFEGEAFTLTSTRRLAKRVPPGQGATAGHPGHSGAPGHANHAGHAADHGHGTAGHAGRFVELRDADSKVLYRRSIGELLSGTIEYRTGDPAHPLRRASAPSHGEVSVLVPDLPGGASVAIVAATGQTGADAAVNASAQQAVPAINERDLVRVDLPAPGEAS